MYMVEERASKRQQELLSFVDGFIKGNGYGPSYREIMSALDYKSVSTVATHIESLITKGYLARRDNSARSLEVVSLRPNQTTAASPISQSVEDLVLQRVNEMQLTPDQRSAMISTFDILKMSKVSDALKQDTTEK